MISVVVDVGFELVVLVEILLLTLLFTSSMIGICLGPWFSLRLLNTYVPELISLVVLVVVNIAWFFEVVIALLLRLLFSVVVDVGFEVVVLVEILLLFSSSMIGICLGPWFSLRLLNTYVPELISLVVFVVVNIGCFFDLVIALLLRLLFSLRLLKVTSPLWNIKMIKVLWAPFHIKNVKKTTWLVDEFHY